MIVQVAKIVSLVALMFVSAVCACWLVASYGAGIVVQFCAAAAGGGAVYWPAHLVSEYHRRDT